mgnify:CR=1 FL=1
MERRFAHGRIVLAKGDITLARVDAVVNAANSSLLGGGGVDGAIHQAGGPGILEACRVLGGCETGDAKITTGGDLYARYVIHTVGPVFKDGTQGEAELLASCYRRSMAVAREHGVVSMAFPAISCGVFGYPADLAGCIAVNTVGDILEAEVGIEQVQFVLFNDTVYGAFEEALSGAGDCT